VKPLFVEAIEKGFPVQTERGEVGIFFQRRMQVEMIEKGLLHGGDLQGIRLYEIAEKKPPLNRPVIKPAHRRFEGDGSPRRDGGDGVDALRNQVIVGKSRRERNIGGPIDLVGDLEEPILVEFNVRKEVESLDDLRDISLLLPFAQPAAIEVRIDGPNIRKGKNGKGGKRLLEVYKIHFCYLFSRLFKEKKS